MPTDAVAAHGGHDHHHDHAQEQMDNKVFGFWLYLMTDCVLFATAFAGVAVNGHSYAGGPTGKDIFELNGVILETACLLISSVTYGFAMLGAYRHNKSQVMMWLAITFLFGLGFIGLEVKEFVHLVSEGNGPERSAFLSSFFLLVATHGCHVTAGLLWMGTLMFQMGVMGKPLNTTYMSRLTMLSLFWHFLDIVWIGVFTVVYLLGSMT
ncbi:MAG TPA: cytochrome o ubiquinol oxidase subunit III [Acidisoma sp.]|jgi:cytochrome o ubiquinol oxidase subunit 3|uniref:cytochrome o ubiquinol oxidase subunit III n=1 Tax=Acidisoma sp. TaxID=1872115 RepID=UPI002C8963CA|nr:cytochrome o ubiquinol oxidase subunit III [Acidisoma sp.]HTI02087.1 cytochrome o ubiquinol oxidase subunit III [Acidisoma sp.]